MVFIVVFTFRQMKFSPHLRRLLILLVGDVTVITLVTLSGFAGHGTLSTAGTRVISTFLSFFLAWFLVAPFLGSYDVMQKSELHQLWRPFWSMIIAAPMGAFLRGIWQNQPILPTFVLVMGGISSMVILAWRAVYWFLDNRKYG